MKKTLASVLVAMLLILSVVPAFAAPACPCEGCTGFLYKKTEERPDGKGDMVVRKPRWDEADNCWLYDYYLYTPMIKETYNQCNCNSSHRFVISTEKYLKKEYVFTDVN